MHLFMWLRYCAPQGLMQRELHFPINSETVNAEFFKGVTWGITFSVPLWGLIIYALSLLH